MAKVVWDSKGFSRGLKQKRMIDDDIDMRTLSAKIDVSPSTISRCENGKIVPDLESYAKLCHYMGQPLNAFIKIK